MKYDEKDREEIEFFDDSRFPIPLEKSTTRCLSKDKRRIFLRITALLCMLLLVITVCLLWSQQRATHLPIDETDAAGEIEEWRGAFAERDIYESCLESTVSIKWGRGESAAVWSGFVLSSDGVIATSCNPIDTNRSGRLYVTLYDGREFSVDSIRQYTDDNCAVLKINANDLSTVNFRDAELQIGERLISLYAGEGDLAVRYGEIASINEDGCKLAYGFGDGSMGAPLYDEEGRLAAFVCDGGEQAFAISVRRAKQIFNKYVKS